MASIQKRGKRWRVFFEHHTRRYAETCLTYQEARHRKAEVEHRLADSRDPFTGTPELIARGIGMTTVEAFEAFTAWCKGRGIADTTFKRYSGILARFIVTCPEFARDIEQRHVALFISEQTSSASHHNNCITAISTFCNCMMELGYLLENPAKTIKRRRIVAKHREILNAEDISKLIAAADEFDRPFMLFVALTGCRLSEAINLTWENTDLKKARVIIRSPKEGHDKPIYLCSQLVEVMKALPQDTSVVFPNRNGSCRCWNSRRMLRNISQRAGIPLEKAQWHNFRHAFATHQILREPPAVVQRLLGHSDLKTTMRYLHVAEEEMQRAAETSIGDYASEIGYLSGYPGRKQ